MENSAEIVDKDWGEKAQLLRSIQLTAGVSKLGIKLLAMRAKLEEVPPNSVIVPQGSQVRSLRTLCCGYNCSIVAIRRLSTIPCLHLHQGAILT